LERESRELERSIFDLSGDMQAAFRERDRLREQQERDEKERREQERTREAQRQQERQQTDKAASDQREAERILAQLMEKTPVVDRKTEKAIDGLFHDIARSRSRGRGR
jgi:hypothetical protein